LIMNRFDLLPEGDINLRIKIPDRTIGAGEYTVYLNFTSYYNISAFQVDSPKYILSFSLVDNNSIRGNNRGGHLSTLLEWKHVIEKSEIILI